MFVEDIASQVTLLLFVISHLIDMGSRQLEGLMRYETEENCGVLYQSCYIVEVLRSGIWLRYGYLCYVVVIFLV